MQSAETNRIPRSTLRVLLGRLGPFVCLYLFVEEFFRFVVLSLGVILGFRVLRVQGLGFLGL